MASFEKPPTQPVASPAPEQPEFAIVTLDEETATTQQALLGIHMTLKAVAGWGRNGEEIPHLLHLARVLEERPTREHVRAAVRYLKGLLNQKQDYN